MNKAYAKGVRGEKKARKLYEAMGYRVVESRGSHGPWDLVAAKRGEVLFIQVKSFKLGKKHAPLPEYDEVLGGNQMVLTWIDRVPVPHIQFIEPKGDM